MAREEAKLREPGPAVASKPVVVTGAASGIGRAVAERFVAAGAPVTLIDIDEEKLLPLARDLGASARVLDVTDEDAVASLFGDADPGFEVVVANAGIALPPAGVHEISGREWRRVIDVNLSGAFNTVGAAARRMMADGIEGRIVVTASMSGLVPEPFATAYTASKFGVVGLVKAAAVELARHGILVNAVCPGDIDTPLLSAFGGDDAEFPYEIPLGPAPDPSQVAGLYEFLAGPDSAYMTGSTILADGGVSSTALYPREPGPSA